jgi:uncharacterized repeat protein (TIGR01451 family)
MKIPVVKLPCAIAPALALLLLATIANGAPKVLPRHLPPEASKSPALGPLSASEKLDLAIGLPLRNRQALSNLIQQLYDPASPLFRKYLTPAQFAEHFGPTEQDYQAVKDFAASRGLVVTRLHSNRTLLNVRGSVAQIERAFNVTLHRRTHPREARVFYAPDTDPAVEASLPILTVGGLDNYVLARPMSLVTTNVASSRNATPNSGSGLAGLYMGNDFRAAYAPGAQLTGTGQTVGLLEFSGFYPADIARYKTLAGLPDVPVNTVLVDGATGDPDYNNIEVALDIEMAISMAPGLSQVLVYEEPNPGNPNTVLNRIATDNIAKQISASWQYPIDANTEQIFQQFAAQGQSFFNSSGDSGAYYGTVAQPSDDPYITIVGGTKLTMSGAGAAWQSETAWNEGRIRFSYVAGGGGISTTYNIPDWQQGINTPANQASGTMRNLPDVAMVAADVLVMYDNGRSDACYGTSISAPLWAAFTALINEQAVSNGMSSVGFINPLLYELGRTPGYATIFHDQTEGNITNFFSPDRFFAAPGYDLCTGWGTPAGSTLINAFFAPIVRPNGTSLLIESCAPANAAIDPGEIVTVNFALRNIGFGNSTNLVATLQSTGSVYSLSGPQVYGVLIPGGAAVTLPFTFAAAGTCGETIYAILQLQDGAQDLGTAIYPLRLGRPLTLLAQDFDEVLPPALPAGWSTAQFDGGSNWITANVTFDTPLNSAYAPEPTEPGIEDLLSPVIAISSPNAHLTFRNRYDVEADPYDSSRGYDGGVLEIKIGDQPFTDILAAQGSFETGGYNRTNASSDNPLFGRQIWSGFSGGFITTVVNLPASAANQNVQFKWRFGTDTYNGYGGTGWYIDTIAVDDGYACCDNSADLAVSQSAQPGTLVLGQSFACVLTVSNAGPVMASSLTVTDTLPAGATLLLASSGGSQIGSNVVFTLNSFAAGSSTNLLLVITPQAPGLLTNQVTVASPAPDPNIGNNQSTLLIPVLAPPSLSLSSVGVAGTNALISVESAVGLHYTLEYSDSLSEPDWVAIPPTLIGTGGVITLLDDTSPAEIGRFYRVRCW